MLDREIEVIDHFNESLEKIFILQPDLLAQNRVIELRESSDIGGATIDDDDSTATIFNEAYADSKMQVSATYHGKLSESMLNDMMEELFDQTATLYIEDGEYSVEYD